MVKAVFVMRDDTDAGPDREWKRFDTTSQGAAHTGIPLPTVTRKPQNSEFPDTDTVRIVSPKTGT